MLRRMFCQQARRWTLTFNPFPNASRRFDAVVMCPASASCFVNGIRCIAASSCVITFLEIQTGNTDVPLMKFHPVWLRDHCRCPECYNSETSQRSNDILAITEDLKIQNHTRNEDDINVEWSDGHKSTYSVSWLLQNTYEGKFSHRARAEERTTWDASSVKHLQLEPVLYQNVMDGTDDALKEVYRRVFRYGFARIERVPTNPEEEAGRLMERVCRVARTVFGSLWETGTNFDHKDTGYLNGYLEAHTDNTYFTEAMGYLVFHCVRFQGTGGASFLVDGFHAAKELKRCDPDAYDYLSKARVEAEYIEPGEHFAAYGPCFRHHPVTGRLEQIRFNLLDRSPLSALPQSEVGRYYRSLQSLAKIIRRPENEYRFHLPSDTVLIIDNWRLLHGRDAFQGKRILRGCYYARSDFVSRARASGIIV